MRVLVLKSIIAPYSSRKYYGAYLINFRAGTTVSRRSFFSLIVYIAVSNEDKILNEFDVIDAVQLQVQVTRAETSPESKKPKRGYHQS